MRKGSALYLLIPLVAATAAVFVPHELFLVRAALLLLLILSFAFAFWIGRNNRAFFLSRVAAVADSGEAARKIASGVLIPCCMLSADGVHWKNGAFDRLLRDRELFTLLPDLNVQKLGASFRANVDERQYDVHAIPLHQEGEERLFLLYWLDKTEAVKYKGAVRKTAAHHLPHSDRQL